MEKDGGLVIPSLDEAEAQEGGLPRAAAQVVAALAYCDGVLSPRRLTAALEAAEAIGAATERGSALRVGVLRALAAPPKLADALPALAEAVRETGPVTRGEILSALLHLLRSAPRDRRSVTALAEALGVPPPDVPAAPGGSVLESFAQKARSLIGGPPPLVAAARSFAISFDDTALLRIAEEAARSRDLAPLQAAAREAAERVRGTALEVRRAAEIYATSLQAAAELEGTASDLERVARQRHAALQRRAAMLKRHVASDLEALVEDAAEEFEADFRRMAEERSMFSGLSNADLGERQVVKNLERRYARLAARYQEEVELLNLEMAEYAEEFTRVSDRALQPMARRDFGAVTPGASLELRLKAAADRASNRTLLLGGTAAAGVAGAAHAGLISAAALAGVVAAPVGGVVLGTLALAGGWKLFASPGERRRRDARERARALQEHLRKQIAGNITSLEQAVDAIVGRFRDAVIAEIAPPRHEAARLREIASGHRWVAEQAVQTALERSEQFLRLAAPGETTPEQTGPAPG